MIFKKKKEEYDVLIYSKWCVECEYPESMKEIQEWALHEGLSYKVIRTAYAPADHTEATELWATMLGIDTHIKEEREKAESYPPFVVYNDIVKLEEFIKMIKDTKNKMVEEGKAKDDLQGLPKAKRHKRARRVDGAVSETEAKNEG